MKNISKTEAAFLLAFLLTIFIPLAGLYPSADKIAGGENRFLHQFPKPGSKDFFLQLDNFWSDHFALRGRYLLFHGLIAGRIFTEQLLHNSVRGHDGWFFLFAPETRDDMRGLRPLIEPDKEAWLAELKKKNAWLRSRGVAYLFVVVPDKHNVYPELLPEGAMKPGTVGRWADLKPFLAPLDPHVVVDLAGPLKNAKKNGRPLFHLDDSHWNYVGALAAAHTLISKAAELGVSTELKADFSDLEPGIFSPMDLVSFESDRRYERVLMPSKRLLALCEAIDRDGPGIHGYSCSGGKKRLLFLGDSYSVTLEPLLAPSFRESYFAMRSLVPLEELVRRFRPDLVIEEHVDREIGNSPSFRAP